MPVPSAINDMWQVRVIGRMEGQECNNILHFSCVGSSTDVETGLILKLIECFTTHLMPVLASTYSLQEVRWKKVSPVLGPEYSTIVGVGAAGGGTATALPSYCSAVVSIRTALGGRSKRGRMYIPGIPEDQTNGSYLDPGLPLYLGLVAFLACVAGEFFHPDPAGGSDLFDIGVYSRKIGGSAFPYGTSGFTAATALTPSSVLGTTRSRKVGRGS